MAPCNLNVIDLKVKSSLQSVAEWARFPSQLQRDKPRLTALASECWTYSRFTLGVTEIKI